jgi:hypothetical protein
MEGMDTKGLNIFDYLSTSVSSIAFGFVGFEIIRCIYMVPFSFLLLLVVRFSNDSSQLFSMSVQ